MGAIHENLHDAKEVFDHIERLSDSFVKEVSGPAIDKLADEHGKSVQEYLDRHDFLGKAVDWFLKTVTDTSHKSAEAHTTHAPQHHEHHAHGHREHQGQQVGSHSHPEQPTHSAAHHPAESHLPPHGPQEAHPHHDHSPTHVVPATDSHSHNTGHDSHADSWNHGSHDSWHYGN
jgi:hypothetical protein